MFGLINPKDYNTTMKNFWYELETPFSVLAPMEDVTDIAFRTLIGEYGRPDVFFTEFTSVDGLESKGKDKVLYRLIKDKSESPIVAQIWGKNPQNYYQSTKKNN